MIVIRCGSWSASVEAILLDKDGTLLDFDRMWSGWADVVIRLLDGIQAGVDWPAALGVKTTENGWKHDPSGPLAMGSNADLAAILTWHLYKAGFSWNVAAELVRDVRVQADEELNRRATAYPMPGVISFVQRCSSLGVKLGLVTADDRSAAERHLAWLGILPHFSTIVGGDEVRQGKPHPEMAERALFQLGASPARTVMIGDTAGDIMMAGAVGLAGTIGLYSGAEAPIFLQQADVLIRHYDELEIYAADYEGIGS